MLITALRLNMYAPLSKPVLLVDGGMSQSPPLRGVFVCDDAKTVRGIIASSIQLSMKIDEQWEYRVICAIKTEGSYRGEKGPHLICPEAGK